MHYIKAKIKEINILNICHSYGNTYEGVNYMENFWTDLLKFLSSISLIAAVVGYLMKIFIENYFNKSIKKFELELELKQKQNEIKFNRLHEDRAQAIKELYGKIVHSRRMCNVFIKEVKIQSKSSIKMIEPVLNANLDFIEFADKNAILFSKEVYNLVNELEITILKTEIPDFSSTNGLPPTDIESIKNIELLLNHEFPMVLELVEKEFRNILGVECK